MLTYFLDIREYVLFPHFHIHNCPLSTAQQRRFSHVFDVSYPPCSTILLCFGISGQHSSHCPFFPPYRLPPVQQYLTIQRFLLLPSRFYCLFHYFLIVLFYVNLSHITMYDFNIFSSSCKPLLPIFGMFQHFSYLFPVFLRNPPMRHETCWLPSLSIFVPF